MDVAGVTESKQNCRPLQRFCLILATATEARLTQSVMNQLCNAAAGPSVCCGMQGVLTHLFLPADQLPPRDSRPFRVWLLFGNNE